jgi:hypothetical protein
MFVIFGWGFTTTHVFGAVFPLLCPNCHNEQFWMLKRIRRWFTLFFIPIFPYESTHALMCPICGVAREMSGVELKRAKLFAETNAAFQSGALREDEYETRLEAIAEASDGQVNKGMAFAASPAISSGVAVAPPPAHVQQQPAAAVPSPTIPATPMAPPVPEAPPSPWPAEAGASLEAGVSCAGCGTQLDNSADPFCPRCGTARRRAAVTS